MNQAPCTGLSLVDLRLTIQQAALLALLPDSPTDGKRCKGPRGRVATALVDKGYAKCVGRTLQGFGYFARTKAGEAAHSEYQEWLRQSAALTDTEHLVSTLWGDLHSVWGLGSENGEEDSIAVSEMEFKKIARRLFRMARRARTAERMGR